MMLPLAVFVLVRLQVGVWPPLGIILLSKWRIFAIRPRFWPAIVRANSVDILVGASTLAFMMQTDSMKWQIIWALLYGVWLVFIKPASSLWMVSLQAGIGQLAALMALFVAWPSGALSGWVLATGAICYLAARHFFDSFNEAYTKLLSYIWAYFGAALTWVLGHMLVTYPGRGGMVTQPVVLLTAIGYSLASIYYLDHFDRLSGLVRREVAFVALMIVAALVVSLYYESSRLIV